MINGETEAINEKPPMINNNEKKSQLINEEK